ncbi:MAG: hypothetical protein R2830_07150 [Saprospiraceae bacterium]
MKKNFTIFPLLSFSFLLVVLMLAWSCNPDVKVNFTINGTDLLPIDDINAVDPNDSLRVLKIWPGDSVVFQDISMPRGNVTSHSWEYTADGIFDIENTDRFSLNFEFPGLYKIILCINGAEKCIAKCIYVQEISEPSLPPTPVVQFISPSEPTLETTEKKFTVELSTINVQDAAELTMQLNGKAFKNFTFSPEDGRLTAEVTLDNGENRVAVLASTDAGTDSDEVVIMREKPASKKNDSGPAPPKAPSPPVVKIKKQGKSTVTSSSYKLQASALNVSDKGDIILTLNGSPVNFSLSGKTVKADLSLEEGENTIKVAAATSAGISNDEVLLTYKKQSPAPEPARKIAPPPPPPVPDPLPEKKITEKPDRLVKPGKIGSPVSSYPTATDCIDIVKNSFSFTLTPKQWVELQSFTIYHDDCGGMLLTLSGPEGSQSTKISLSGLKTQVTFGSIDARLEPNTTYTVTCATLAGYGGCPSSTPPNFENTKACAGTNPTTSSVLGLDQKGKQIIFDLKFLY